MSTATTRTTATMMKRLDTCGKEDFSSGSLRKISSASDDGSGVELSSSSSSRRVMDTPRMSENVKSLMLKMTRNVDEGNVKEGW